VTRAAALVALVVAAGTVCADPGAERMPAGAIRLFKIANSSFDRWTSAPDPEQQAWIQRRFWRMLTYAPYFDSRLAWYPRAWVYKDLYAIYTDAEPADPSWILRDAAGARLYIPYDCEGGTCPQWAGDIGSPAFRRQWIEAARALLGKGYRGLFVDDVNMSLTRVSDGHGNVVAPIDPRTGRAMTEADWRRYMADFVEEIRRAVPDAEIAHNPLWFFGHDDPQIVRQLLAADVINLERGVNDAGITAGGGRYGFDAFVAYIDWLHARGRRVILEASARTDGGREYGLAAYFALNDGADALANGRGTTPDDWWRGYDVDLGAARGPRYTTDGVMRRDFERGAVFVNPPGARRRTLAVAPGHVDLGGSPATSVTLGPAEGRVLRTGVSNGNPS
jgi:hypothetical protein